MEQKRFLIALLVSFAILFGWNYLFRPEPGPQNNTNATQPAASNTPAPQQSPAQTADAAPAQTQDPAAPATDDVPQRTLTVESELYRVRLDSRGAVATSWVIKKRKKLSDNLDREEDLQLHSAAGSRRNPRELELISPEGVRRDPREVPLRLETGDRNLDAALANRNYNIVGVEGDAVEVRPGEQKQINFVMRDPATGAEVTKSLTFLPDSYVVNFAVKVVGNQTPQSVRVAVGPSIGDQGISHYTFYSVAPEAVYAPVNQDAERVLASSVHTNEQTPDRQPVAGPVNWAAVADTYFSMVLVPSRPVEGLEYRTTKYEHVEGSEKQERHLITGFVPVPADGSVSQLYVGPKDHYLLDDASAQITSTLGGRAVDLEKLIDYGFGSTITRPLALPILWSIRRLNALTGSYGIAIVLFTIGIYSLFFPLKWRTTKSMKKAQKLAPRMKELQEKIKELQSKSKANNEAKLKELQMEQLRLMKEGNPLGGCLPLVIQMPFLFALFRAITISLDFRQASFLWMSDLSAADPWHLLPVLMAGSMLVIQWVTPAPSADPLQRKMFMVMLPAMMLYMMWSAPAGLLVYWFVGNLVTFGQQMVINRMIKDDEEPPAKGDAEKVKPKKLGQPRTSQA